VNRFAALPCRYVREVVDRQAGIFDAGGLGPGVLTRLVGRCSDAFRRDVAALTEYGGPGGQSSGQLSVELVTRS